MKGVNWSTNVTLEKNWGWYLLAGRMFANDNGVWWCQSRKARVEPAHETKHSAGRRRSLRSGTRYRSLGAATGSSSHEEARFDCTRMKNDEVNNKAMLLKRLYSKTWNSLSVIKKHWCVLSWTFIEVNYIVRPWTEGNGPEFDWPHFELKSIRTASSVRVIWCGSQWRES
mgnify:FL=1